MPLVQWIMQNLSTPNAQGGAVGGGTALVQQTSFVIATGGANASGTSFYEKISSIIATPLALSLAPGKNVLDPMPPK